MIKSKHRQDDLFIYRTIARRKMSNFPSLISPLEPDMPAAAMTSGSGLPCRFDFEMRHTVYYFTWSLRPWQSGWNDYQPI